MISRILTFRHFKEDLFGGITAGIVALPLALGFGIQSGMGATAGLYGAFALGALAALFGGTKTQVSGPTGPMTVLMTALVSAIAAISSENALGLILLTIILAGVFQVIFGLLRFGSYVRFIPYPVVSGFMTGIGVIIIIFQFFPAMGYYSEETIVGVFRNIGTPVQDIKWDTFLLTFGTIGLIYLVPKLTRAVPSSLVALLVMTLISFFFFPNVPLIGDIPSGFPELKLSALYFPDIQQWKLVGQYAFMLAALGSIDSLLTSVIADTKTRTRHNSNKELIGQGIGNIFCGFIGGLPGAGATMRTMVNINSGGKTNLSGFIHSMIILLILLGAGQYASFIPRGVLSGILITVGISIIDYKGLKHLFIVPRADAIILIVVLLVTVFGNLLVAVILGLILASVLFMKKASDIAEKGTSIDVIEDAVDLSGTTEEAKNPLIEKNIYIKSITGPLFFGFTSSFLEKIREIPDAKILLLNLRDVPYIDQSGAYALENMVRELREQKILVVISGIRKQPESLLTKLDVIPGSIRKKLLFRSVRHFSKWMKRELKFNRMNIDRVITKYIRAEYSASGT